MGKEEVFDYYYGTEAEQFSFFRIPRVLIQDSRFKQVSTDAKLLYGLMLDRMSLSMKNGWLDEENRVYIIYTLENIMEDLNCGKDKGVKILAELDTVKGIGLIERKKRGLGKPSIIFVKNFASLVVEKKTEAEKEEDSIKIVNEIQSSEEPKSEKLSVRSPEFGKTEVLPSEKQQSGVLENGSLDFGKIEGNYNKDFNYNEFSYTERNHNNPINLSEVDGIDCYMALWTIVNKVDTIYKEKCRVQLLSAVPSTILLFHLVSSFRENYAVSWHYRILRCIRIQITGVPAENDMFYG